MMKFKLNFQVMKVDINESTVNLFIQIHTI